MRGFGLLDMLMVLGLTSAMLLASTTYMDNTRQEMMRLYARQNVETIKSDIQTALISLPGCRSLLGLGAAPLAINVAQAARPDRGQALELRTPSGEIIEAGTSLRRYQGLHVNGVFLNSLTAIGVRGANQVYLGSLVASFAVEPGGFTFADTNLGNLMIEVAPAGSVATCIPNAPGGFSPASMCASLGGTYNGTACVLPLAIRECTPGETKSLLDLNCGVSWCGGHTGDLIEYGRAHYSCQGSGQWVQVRCTGPNCGRARR